MAPRHRDSTASGSAGGSRRSRHGTGEAKPEKPPEIIGDYIVKKTIGEGSFGKVKLAAHAACGLPVAMKFISLKRLSPENHSRVQREIEYLSVLNHPHIMKLYEVIQTPTDIIMVSEYLDRGELFDYIIKTRQIAENVARKFFQQLMSAIEYCHARGIVHRDLKPENLLLDAAENLKIADFGLSNLMRDGDFLKTSCGSPNYASPEVIQGRLYAGPEIDIWSCGVILYVMLCGKLPFDDEHIPALFRKINGGIFSLPPYLSSGARHLIQRMLVVDINQRAKINEIKSSPWFVKDFPEALRRIPSTPRGEGEKKAMERLRLSEIRRESGSSGSDLNTGGAGGEGMERGGSNTSDTGSGKDGGGEGARDGSGEDENRGPAGAFEPHDIGPLQQEVIDKLCERVEGLTSEEAWQSLKDKGRRNKTLQIAYMLVKDSMGAQQDQALRQFQENIPPPPQLKPKPKMGRAALQRLTPAKTQTPPLGTSAAEDDQSEDEVAVPYSNISILEDSLKHSDISANDQPKRTRARQRWNFGIRSRSTPMEVMAEIYRVLQGMGFEWRRKQTLEEVEAEIETRHEQAEKDEIEEYRGRELDDKERERKDRAGAKRRRREMEEKEKKRMETALSLYFIEARYRHNDVMLRVDLQLYKGTDPDNYVVDFRNKGCYPVSGMSPPLPQPPTFEDSGIPSEDETSTGLTDQKEREAARNAAAAISIAARNRDSVSAMSSPYLFLDVMAKLILELAGG